jgi:hypothetical protein
MRLVWHGALYGQNLPYKFKKSYGDFQNRNFKKSHRRLEVRTTGPRSDLSETRSVRSETGFVILSKFWSIDKYDFQNFRNRIVLGEDHGELNKGTVRIL